MVTKGFYRIPGGNREDTRIPLQGMGPSVFRMFHEAKKTLEDLRAKVQRHGWKMKKTIKGIPWHPCDWYYLCGPSSSGAKSFLKGVNIPSLRV